jgi:hypothetical protein
MNQTETEENYHHSCFLATSILIRTSYLPSNAPCIIGSYLTMETSLAIDTLPKDYDDGPSGGNAQLLGIWGVAAFLGSALGPMIGGPLLYIFGNSGVTDGQDYTIQGYTVLLSLSTAYFLLSAITLRWIKKASV